MVNPSKLTSTCIQNYGVLRIFKMKSGSKISTLVKRKQPEDISNYDKHLWLLNNVSPPSATTTICIEKKLDQQAKCCISKYDYIRRSSFHKFPQDCFSSLLKFR